MTRRILFHYPVLNVGGAEMSTLRLATALADRGWNVEMVVTTGGGTLEARLDPRIRLTALRSRLAGDRFLAARGARARLVALPDLAAYGLQRLREAVVSAGYLFRRYDAAVIGLQGLSPAFCCDRVRARVRLHWIRNDVRRVDDRGRIARQIGRYHRRTDYYPCVAETARAALVERFAYLGDKALTLHNVLDVESMRRRAEGEPDPFPPTGASLRVLTVCRLADKPKALFRMARACRRLLDQGFDFQWFIAGEGPDREALQRLIDELGLTGRMILAGRQANPFPWYRHADVVAVLSNYEGLSGVVNEAKVMGRPVIATRFSGITEQIENEVNGLIVDNDEDAIVAGMARMLGDRDLRERLGPAPLPAALADDEAKLARLESLILGGRP